MFVCVRPARYMSDSLSKVWLPGVRYLIEVKIYSVARLGTRKVSAVRSLQVVVSRRLPMYYINRIFNP